MNLYSKRKLAGMALGLALVAGACGSGSSDKATSKADWNKAHGADITALSTDLDLARTALDKGDRPVILSSCNQLQEDIAAARKGLPVPDPASDTALRGAIDAIAAGVPDCIEGGRVASQARITESAQAKMKDARPKMDDATKALAAWQ